MNDPGSARSSNGDAESTVLLPKVAEAPQMADPLELAVVWVEKARKGSTQWMSSCPQRQMFYYGIRKRSKPLVFLATVVYMLLAFVEEPSWCLGDATPCADSMRDMLSGPFPVLPFQLSNSLELACLVAFAARTWLRLRSLGNASRGGRWNLFGQIILAVAALDCAVAIVNIKGIMFWNNFRVSRLCRPLIFLACYKRLRDAAGRVVRSIPDFFNVLASLGICVLLFAFISIVLFNDTEEGELCFSSFNQALASMWILYTTANNPDVWVQGYNSYRAAFFFFAIYLVLSLYLLNNILLATVYDAYKKQLTSHVIQFHKNRDIALESAFKLIAESGSQVIGKSRWFRFFAVYCDPGLGGVGLDVPAEAVQKLSDKLFTVLDTDGSGGISRTQFKECIRFLHGAEEFLPTKAVKRPQFTDLYRLMTVGRPWRGWRIRWDDIVDLFIAVAVLTVFVHLVISLDTGRPVGSHRAFTRQTLAITAVYLVEVVLKASILGLDRYWNRGRSMQHRLDLITVVALVVLHPFHAFVSRPISIVGKSVVLLHISRVSRLLHHVKPIEQLGQQIIYLLPTFRLMLYLLITVYYIYVTIGMQVFGGKIRKAGEYGDILAGTPFDAADYYALNFNDFFSGMVLMFVVMIVNNWFIFSNAFSDVTGTIWAHAFFVSFFVLVNLIVLNILMALILDCFASLREEVARLVEEEDEPSDPKDTKAMVDRIRSQNLSREEMLKKVLIDSGDGDGNDST